MVQICCVSPLTAQVSMGGIIIHNAPVLTLNAAEEYANGTSLTEHTLSLSIQANLNWTLSVRAETDFMSLDKSIPSTSIQLQVVQSSFGLGAIALTQFDQDIAKGNTYALMGDIPIHILYSCSGGNQFLEPADDYTTTIIFTLTMVNI